MHIERQRDQHLIPSHFDVPDNFDWSDVKAWGNSLLSAAVPGGNPAYIASTAAAQQTKNALAATGKTLTTAESDLLYKKFNDTTTTTTQKSVDKNIVQPALSFLSGLKWLIIGLIVFIVWLQFKK